MRISDWSSDVCSSDLLVDRHQLRAAGEELLGRELFRGARGAARRLAGHHAPALLVRAARPLADLRRGDRGGLGEGAPRRREDRKSVVSGKSVSVRVDLGGRRIIKKTK